MEIDPTVKHNGHQEMLSQFQVQLEITVADDVVCYVV